MSMQFFHLRSLRLDTGISAAILLSTLALAFPVDGIGVAVTATAVPVPNVRLTRLQRATCDECGTVATTRRMTPLPGEAAATAVTQYEVTVRMWNGSIQTFVEASTVRWRPGERIILIAGSG